MRFEKGYHPAMRKSSNIPKPLVFLVMAIYVFMPLYDAVACSDCSVFDQEAKPASYSVAATNADESALLKGGEAQGGMSAEKSEVKDLCPLCFNTPQTRIDSGNNPLASVACVNKTILVVHLDPSFPISKPPQI